MLTFELWTFARPVVQLAPSLWAIRSLLYFALATPGVLVCATLMPPLLPSLGLLIAAAIN